MFSFSGSIFSLRLPRPQFCTNFFPSLLRRPHILLPVSPSPLGWRSTVPSKPTKWREWRMEQTARWPSTTFRWQRTRVTRGVCRPQRGWSSHRRPGRGGTGYRRALPVEDSSGWALPVEVLRYCWPLPPVQLLLWAPLGLAPLPPQLLVAWAKSLLASRISTFLNSCLIGISTFVNSCLIGCF
jgi:hypothetical protein